MSAEITGGQIQSRCKAECLMLVPPPVRDPGPAFTWSSSRSWRTWMHFGRRIAAVILHVDIMRKQQPKSIFFFLLHERRCGSLPAGGVEGFLEGSQERAGAAFSKRGGIFSSIRPHLPRYSGDRVSQRTSQVRANRAKYPHRTPV